MEWEKFGREVSVPVLVPIDMEVKPEGGSFTARTRALGPETLVRAPTREKAIAALEAHVRRALARTLTEVARAG